MNMTTLQIEEGIGPVDLGTTLLDQMAVCLSDAQLLTAELQADTLVIRSKTQYGDGMDQTIVSKIKLRPGKNRRKVALTRITEDVDLPGDERLVAIVERLTPGAWPPVAASVAVVGYP